MSKALLVLDVQTALFASTPAPHDANGVIERINMLMHKARVSGVPVITVQTNVLGFLEKNSDGWQLCAGLQTVEEDLRLDKAAADTFHKTSLQVLLDQHSVRELIVCGYASEYCVDSTVRRASTLGYSVQLVSDAHTTTDKPHLSAEKIREHHTLTLAMGQAVRAVTADAAEFG